MLNVGQEAPPPVEKKFAEIVGFVSDHTSLAIAERESFASNFVEIFQCKFGELEQLSTLQFSADENHRYALKILQQIKVIVKSVIDLIIQQKQGMIIAGVFQQDLNSDRLASKFRVLLSKRIDERSIRDIAFKEVKYGASTPKYSKPPQKDLLDDLNAELGKFNCTKNKTQNFVRKTNVVDLLDGPEIDHPFYRYRKHSINIDMGLRLPTYDASLTTIQTNALTKQPDQRISIYDEQKEAKNALKLKDIPEKFNFEKAEEPVLKAHSLYTRKQWEVPKIARTVKNGKYRYLQRNEPAKVDFDVIIAKSDLLRLKLIEGDQVQGQIEKCIP